VVLGAKLMVNVNKTIAKKVKDRFEVWRFVRREDPILQLRSIMRSKGIKNVDLAERLGVSEANVSRWLRGTQNLGIDTLYSLADAIEEPLTVFFGATSNSSHVEEGVWKEHKVMSNVIDFHAYRHLFKDKPLWKTRGRSRDARISASR
jgi:transcriptional regulator with XRE-family HTH domain